MQKKSVRIIKINHFGRHDKKSYRKQKMVRSQEEIDDRIKAGEAARHRVLESMQKLVDRLQKITNVCQAKDIELGLINNQDNTLHRKNALHYLNYRESDQSPINEELESDESSSCSSSEDDYDDNNHNNAFINEDDTNDQNSTQESSTDEDEQNSEESTCNGNSQRSRMVQKADIDNNLSNSAYRYS